MAFSVMQRERRHPITGRLLHRITVEELDEIRSGFWFPVKLRNIVFDSKDSSEQSIELDSRVIVRRVLLNDAVSESMFLAPTNKPGAILIQPRGGFTQFHDGGEDLLDEIVMFMRKQGFPRKRNQSLIFAHIPFIAGFIIGSTACLLAVWSRRCHLC